MARETRPVHPLYPDVTAEQWEDAKRRVAVMVEKRVQRQLGDPWDIAEDAIRRAYEPTAPVWDREKRSLAFYLGSFANSMMANGVRKVEFKTTRPLYDSDVRKSALAIDDPEEAAAHAEAVAITARRMAQVREMVADDRCCVILVDAVSNGEPNPHKLALAEGFTYRKVELAREMIQRAAQRVVAAEARPSGKKG